VAGLNQTNAANQAQQALFGAQPQAGVFDQFAGATKNLGTLAGAAAKIPGVKEAIGGLFGAGTTGSTIAAGSGAVAPAVGGSVGAIAPLGAAGAGGPAAAAAPAAAAPAAGLPTGAGLAVALPVAAALAGRFAPQFAIKGLRQAGLFGGTPNPQVVRVGASFGEDGFGRFAPRITAGSAQDEVAQRFEDFTKGTLEVAGIDPNDVKGDFSLDGGQFVVRDDEGEEIGRFDDMVSGLQAFVGQNTDSVFDFSEFRAPDLDQLEVAARQREFDRLQEETAGMLPGVGAVGEALRLSQMPTLAGTTFAPGIGPDSAQV
jgi:hypothetical protein